MSKAKLRALVVDDNKALCRRVQRMLSDRAGVEAVAVHSFLEGVQLLRDEPFDLALIDLHLGDGDGSELAREAELDPVGRPYIIVVSGTQDVREVTESWRAGARRAAAVRAA